MVFFSRVISFKARSNRAVVYAQAASLCKTAEWAGQKTGVEYKPFNDGDRLKTASKWSGAK
jgi:hypothetical protein